MAFIRSVEILKEINMVFERSDFELRSGKKRRKANQYKLQPIINVNGTITVVASHTNGAVTYLTFSGDGIVELWPWKDTFLIDRKEYEPAEIRRQFRSMLEKDYGFEFKNGGHYALGGEIYSGMLLNPRIIPQIFTVFQESDFDLSMWSCNIPTEITHSKRMLIAPFLDGRIIISIGIENPESEYSYAGEVVVLFDGSNTVSIGNRTDVRCREDLNNPEKVKTVVSEDARHILMEQYGVSFQTYWRMNTPPSHDSYGRPYYQDVFEIVDQNIVYGPYLFRRRLVESELDYLVTEEERERLLAYFDEKYGQQRTER